MSMLISLIMLGLGTYYWSNGQKPGGYVRQPSAIYPDRARNPMLLEDDKREKSMYSGQRQDTVRLPFGPPNAFQKTIDDPSFLMSNPVYGTQYQKNMRNIQIRTEQWEVDPKFNSPLNNYASMHMPEYPLQAISNWSNKKGY